ncbi:hypothetical protein [Gordonia cholesterolivorans]|uniref:J domain-containing protein n=1 Tax=Gordonia cholesterolivorans TaxID=559625 RepID=A0ABN3HC82_9ACTN
MPELGPNQPTNYYHALGLDPAAPHDELLAQLQQRIALTQPGPERGYAEQARAVLADLGKRRIYDQRLHNPNTNPWTPGELHELAIAQPTESTAGLLTQLKAAPTRIMAIVAGALLIVLVIIVTAVACTGGSADVASDLEKTSEVSPHSEASDNADSNTDPADCTVLTGNRRWDIFGKLQSSGGAVRLLTEYRIPLPNTPTPNIESAPIFLADGGLAFFYDYPDQDKKVSVAEISSSGEVTTRVVSDRIGEFPDKYLERTNNVMGRKIVNTTVVAGAPDIKFGAFVDDPTESSIQTDRRIFYSLDKRDPSKVIVVLPGYFYEGGQKINGIFKVYIGEALETDDPQSCVVK